MDTTLADAVAAYQASLAAIRASIDMTATALTNNPREALTDTAFLRHFFNLLREEDLTLMSRTQRSQLEDAMKTAVRTVAGESFSRLRFTEGHFSATLELNVDQIGGVEKLQADAALAETLRDISHALEHAASTTLEVVVITKQSSTQDTFVTDPYDGMTRRTSWSKNPAWYGQTAKDWYGHKTYKTLIAAMADTFVYPEA